MSFAQIYLIEGRNADQKRVVIEKVTEALMEAVNGPRENFRVLIQEVPKTNWGIGGKMLKDFGLEMATGGPCRFTPRRDGRTRGRCRSST